MRKSLKNRPTIGVLERGKITMQGAGDELLQDPDISKASLGGHYTYCHCEEGWWLSSATGMYTMEHVYNMPW